jgi:malonyl-CoA O-methyltransferase
MKRWLDRMLGRPIELSSAEAYERWAPCYMAGAHNRLMALEEEAVLEMLPDVRGRACLDLACGSGRYIRILTERGAAHVLGIDISAAMLTRARETGTDLVQTDLTALGLRSRSFQIVTCSLAVGHVRNLQASIGEISRVLAPGGTLIYSDFHPIGRWLRWKRSFRGSDGIAYSAQYHTHLYADHVNACLASGLHIEEVREPRIDFKSKWREFPALLIIRAART